MNKTTRDIIVAAIAADRTIGTEQAKDALKVLEGVTLTKDRKKELERKRPLTMAEACKLTGYCPRTIQNLVYRGRVRVVRVTSDRASRYNREDLERVVQGEPFKG